MIEVKGVEACNATGDLHPQCELFIYAKDELEIKPGVEILVIVSSSTGEGPEYGIALRLLDNREPEENEMLVQYGDRVFIGQKLPEFI